MRVFDNKSVALPDPLSSADHNHSGGKPVEYFPNSTVTYNVFPDNGFVGAIDDVINFL